MLRLLMGLMLMLGLGACQDEKSISHQDAASAVHITAAETSVKSMPTLNETNTQDVKKEDIVPVEISSTTISDSASVAEAMLTQKQIMTEKAAEVAPVVEAVVAAKPAVKAAPESMKTSVLTEKVATSSAPVMVKKEAMVEKVAESSASNGNAENGKALAKRCLACHDFGMKDKVGPHLKGIFNRAAGQSGFGRHSAALKNANWMWNEAHLLKWVCDSKAAVKEFTGDASATTKMGAQKVCGSNGDDLLAYLKTL